MKPTLPVSIPVSIYERAKKSFSRAAPTYKGGDIHNRAIKCLANMLANINNPKNNLQNNPTRWLDIGCGKGNLAKSLPLGFGSKLKVFADLSLAMTKRITAPDALAVVANAEQPPFKPGGFELVTSAMALQWCKPNTISRLLQLLAKNGTLAIALPIAPSLSNWQKVCGNNGIQSSLIEFPQLPQLVAELKIPSRRVILKMETRYQNPLQFLKDLKQWGATASSYPPQSLLKLRGAKSFVANWHIACIVARK